MSPKNIYEKHLSFLNCESCLRSGILDTFKTLEFLLQTLPSEKSLSSSEIL